MFNITTNAVSRLVSVSHLCSSMVFYVYKALKNISDIVGYICSDHATDKPVWDFRLMRMVFCLVVFFFFSFLSLLSYLTNRYY